MATNVKRKKKKAEVMAEDGSMTLTGHLKELRNRLIICAVVFVVGVVVSLAYADRLIDLLTAMGRDYYEFVSIAPQEKLMQYFRVSILAGVVVTVPVAFYHIYAFAKPGLKRSESTFFKLVMLLGLILFCVGVLFAYKLMMPFMLRFLSTGIEGAEYSDHLLHRGRCHPAGYRVSVHGGRPHGAAVLHQHPPERHLL